MHTDTTPEFSAIEFKGDAAADFLQGQLTIDIITVTSTLKFSAYCTPKGKVKATLFIKKTALGFLGYISQDLAHDFLQDISKYALLSRVKLTHLPINSAEFIADLNQIGANLHTFNEIYPWLIANSYPIITKACSEMFFVHDLSLDKSEAVSFSKGCYRGQEIIARMQHRGNIKRSLFKFTTISESILAIGSPIMLDNQAIGTIIMFSQRVGLAVLNRKNLTDKIIDGATGTELLISLT